MPEAAVIQEPLPTRQRILVVDDERHIRDVLAELLEIEGFEVITAADGVEAIAKLELQSFDVVVSDLKMPNIGGLEVMKAVGRLCPDAVTVIMTGFGTVESAVRAMKEGAHDYVLKPFKADDLLAVIQNGLAKRELAHEGADDWSVPSSRRSPERERLEIELDRVLASMALAIQPIIYADTCAIYGYEALLRAKSTEMSNPGAVLHAAEVLGRLHDLGRRVRELALGVLSRIPEHAMLFLNAHPQDLLDPELFDADGELAKHASRIVIEITERSSLEQLGDIQAHVARLRTMGYRIAVDDLGAGYSGLTSLAQIEPEIVKLDMSLVRGIHNNPTRQKVVRSMTALAKDMGSLVVAEGVECEEEKDALLELGCDLLQGFLIARPSMLPPMG